MRKKHDQLLREIYAINKKSISAVEKQREIENAVLTSCALPATTYGFFKTFSKLEDVALNGAQLTFEDLYTLAFEAQRLWLSRSYKQHQVPESFFDYIVTTLYNLNMYFEDKEYALAEVLLTEAVAYIDKYYGYHITRDLEKQYRDTHSELPRDEHGWVLWYIPENRVLTEAEQNAFDAYRKFHKKLHFGYRWRFLRFFDFGLLQPLKRIIGLNFDTDNLESDIMFLDEEFERR